MKPNTIGLIFLLLSALSFGQNASKGDFYYYENAAYKEAIREYNKELSKKKLTHQQYLNLADSYLKTGNFEKASQIYVESYERDSTQIKSYVNKLLLATSQMKDTTAFHSYLTKFSPFFTKELLENSDFNREILNNNQNNTLDFYIYNCNINSAQADFSPSFYKDEVLFTTAREKDKSKIYKRSGEAYLDIFSGKIQPDGDVTVAKSFTKIPSSKYHKATPFYAEDLDFVIYMLSNADGNELLFDKQMNNTLAIGSVNQKGDFQYLLRDLSTSFYYPFYEASSSKLYFAANFEGGYGGTDLYYVFTNKGQIMSAPINLGPRINTPGNEVAPFIFEGSLYFSSDIFYGLGDMDIYVSKYQADDTFSIPVNLGSGINSSSHDFGFIIRRNSEGLLGYFSSNREGGKGNDDIYGFKVSEKPGLKTLVIKGFVQKPNTSVGIKNVHLVLLDTEGNLLKTTLTNDLGAYQFEVPFRDTYALRATKVGYGSFSETYSNKSQEEQQVVSIALPYIEDVVEQKENQTVLKLNTLVFKSGSSGITPAIESELDKVVAIVQSFPNMQLGIESHTDSRGSTSNNQKLSQARAQAIKDYLVSKGVPSKLITQVIGYGESKLTNQCKDGVFCLEFLHEKNLRSYISVLNYSDLKN